MDSVTIPALLFIPLVLILYGILRPRSLPLPPGPAGLPLIGNLLSIIKENKNPKPRHLKYIEMGNLYHSDIVHFQVLGDHTIVLNSAKATTELLEKRSAIYSDRPPMPMLTELSGWHWSFAFSRYSDSWRNHRRTFFQYFRPTYISTYHPIQRREILRLLGKLVNRPREFREHLRNYTVAISLQLTYGITSEEGKKQYIDLADRAMKSFIAAGNRGDFLVDYFPLLKYVPTWLPGASFRKQAKIWSTDVIDLNEGPWSRLKSTLANGAVVPCLAADALEKFDFQIDKMEEVIKNICGASYIAGTDTTASLLLFCILALVCHPDDQKRAQVEIDAIVGDGRLPDFSDREKLPYIECILKETQRLWPSIPLGVEHYSSNDDIYQGYLIPKGTTIIGNAWAILHDEETYADPMRFKPDRFFKETGKQCPPDPTLYSFGFGRRICPGRYIALDNAWLMIACILTVFTVEKALDASGNEIEVKMEHNHGAVTHPLPFQCRFTPRSTQVLNLLSDGFSDQEVAD